AQSGVPRGFLRSVEHGNNAFAKECFLDEIAAAAGADPYELRLRLLEGKRTGANPYVPEESYDTSRLARVAPRAAEKAGGGRPTAAGRGVGIAAHMMRNAYAAGVCEVSAEKDGPPRVRRVVCAVDCGLVVNPDTVESVVEGGVVFGLTMALKGEI